VTVLDSLVDTYAEVLAELARQGAVWVRLDEPVLVEDRTDDELAALRRAYRRLSEQPGRPSIVVSTYFGHVGSAMTVLADLPVEGVGLDFCRGQENLALLSEVDGLDKKVLFAGVVDGRNVWANDLDASLDLLERLTSLCDEVVVSTSCSLLHVPLGLGTEGEIDDEVRPWLAFAEEKLGELAVLSKGATEGRAAVAAAIQTNRAVLEARNRSPRVRDAKVRGRWPRPPSILNGRRHARSASSPSAPGWACRCCRPRPSGRSPRPPGCVPLGRRGGPDGAGTTSTEAACGSRSTGSSPCKRSSVST
jgi:5-methyltetrahydropteroyltriglutamate--homocysteine methyltransferase